MERQKKPTRQVACEITKDGVVTEKSTQLGEWDLEAIQAHADFLSLKDTELNLKELKASRHTPTPHHRTNAEPNAEPGTVNDDQDKEQYKHRKGQS